MTEVELKKAELEVLRGWINYFNELLEEIDCVECIKVNKNNSTDKIKHFDLYCEKCFQQKEIRMQERREADRKEYEIKSWKKLMYMLEKDFFQE